jgi:two-component system, cell cycle response regulator DivK
MVSPPQTISKIYGELYIVVINTMYFQHVIKMCIWRNVGIKFAYVTAMEHGTLQGLSVLVVEDDPANAKLLAVFLRTEGCEARVASSAEEAIETLRAYHPNLMLLDLVLPRMSGFGLLEKMKADPDTRDIAIVAVSAMNGGETERRVRQAGGIAYFRKPIDLTRFSAQLTDSLGGVS